MLDLLSLCHRSIDNKASPIDRFPVYKWLNLRKDLRIFLQLRDYHDWYISHLLFINIINNRYNILCQDLHRLLGKYFARMTHNSHSGNSSNTGVTKELNISSQTIVYGDQSIWTTTSNATTSNTTTSATTTASTASTGKMKVINKRRVLLGYYHLTIAATMSSMTPNAPVKENANTISTMLKDVCQELCSFPLICAVFVLGDDDMFCDSLNRVISRCQQLLDESHAKASSISIYMGIAIQYRDWIQQNVTLLRAHPRQNMLESVSSLPIESLPLNHMVSQHALRKVCQHYLTLGQSHVVPTDDVTEDGNVGESEEKAHDGEVTDKKKVGLTKRDWPCYDIFACSFGSHELTDQQEQGGKNEEKDNASAVSQNLGGVSAEDRVISHFLASFGSMPLPAEHTEEGEEAGGRRNSLTFPRTVSVASASSTKFPVKALANSLVFTAVMSEESLGALVRQQAESSGKTISFSLVYLILALACLTDENHRLRELIVISHGDIARLVPVITAIPIGLVPQASLSYAKQLFTFFDIVPTGTRMTKDYDTLTLYTIMSDVWRTARVQPALPALAKDKKDNAAASTAPLSLPTPQPVTLSIQETAKLGHEAVLERILRIDQDEMGGTTGVAPGDNSGASGGVGPGEHHHKKKVVVLEEEENESKYANVCQICWMS